MKVKFTDEYIIETAKKFNTRKDFRCAHDNLYHLVKRRGLDDAAFGHMVKLRHYVSDGVAERECTSCGVIKPYADFYASSYGGIRSKCKKCCDAASIANARANPERSRAANRKHDRNNPEKVRARAKVKRDKNPESYAARDMLKRVLKLTGQKKTTKTEKILGYTFQELRQHIESHFEEGMSWSNRGDWHIDHIVPVAVMIRDGITCPSKINALSNLRPLWARDNLAKIWEARGDNCKN